MATERETTVPRIEHRELQHYVGIRRQITVDRFPETVDTGWPLVFGWMAERGIESAAAPFIRYCVIGDDGRLQIELGAPVAAGVDGDEAVQGGVLPSGRYVVLRHVGPFDGLVAAHARLKRWADEHGVAFDRWHTGHGEAWRSSAEHYLVDPSEEPDPSKWEVELTYLTAS